MPLNLGLYDDPSKFVIIGSGVFGIDPPSKACNVIWIRRLIFVDAR